jgi:two-component system response regulator AtoC
VRCSLTVLVVETDSDVREKLCGFLRQRYPRVLAAENCQAALEVVGENDVDVLAVDVSDEHTDGLELLRLAGNRHSHLMAVAIAETGDTQNALRAIKLGAYRCLIRPLEKTSLAEAIDGAGREVLKSHATLQTRRLLAVGQRGKRLIGNSTPMMRVFERIDLVRRVDSNVIVLGETGTGKELVAYAIHRNSSRARHPFVKLNCGAIPRDLLESELFGHEKGSFTGALQQRIGLFEQANRGTILLDEIGDMPLELQVKLLSVIQDRAVQRVGGHERIPVDVRIIAATHQDLEKATKEGRFRLDLYYRLKVVTIYVPPLRERKEDIPLLVRHFLERLAKTNERKLPSVDPDAMQLLMNYDYPGNVRELENVIESSLVLCLNGAITPEELPSCVRAAGEASSGELRILAGTPLEEVERLCIIETLRHTEGNKRRAAGLLGISEKSVYNKLERYKIDVESLKDQGQPGAREREEEP